MDTKTLHYFTQVCQKGSISKAAQSLHLSQQGLCTILDKLEAEIGVKLLKRTKRGTRLTADGMYLLSRAEEILQIEKECRMYFERFKEDTEVLSIACAFGTYGTLVREFAETFKTRKKGLRIDLTEHPDIFCERVLREGVADVGFTTKSMDNTVFESHLLKSHQVCAVVHESFPLAQYQAVDIRQLKGLPIILMNKNFHIHQDFICRCAAWEFTPIFQFEAAEIAMVHRLAEKGEGIGITLKPIYEEYMQPHMRIIPFTDATFTWNIYLTIRRFLKPNSTAEEFCRYALSADKDNL